MNEIDKSQYCVSCLCYNNHRNLQSYRLHCESLKTIFQKDYLCLCYLCKRLIENAEIFIQTVLNNQILLQNNEINITDKTKGINPICSLSIEPLDTLELYGYENQSSESVSVHKYGVYRDCNVKVELKCEEDSVSDNDGDNFSNDADFNIEVKEEECNLESPLDVKLDTEDLNPDILKEDIKKTEVTEECEKKRKSTSAFNIELFHLTRAQCMEELKMKAADENYLNALYKCVHCVKGYTFKPSYDKHMELHSKEMGEYECDVCKQRMDSKEKLVSHRRCHEVRYRCGECGLVRINRRTILEHYATLHSDGSEFACRFCHKSFKRRLLLQRHVSYAHKKMERVICAHCSRTYVNKDVLKSHIMMKHPEQVSAVEPKRKWTCEDCGKAFNALSRLKMHSTKHSLERGFYCVECDKSFKTENGLKQHLKIAMSHVSYKDLPLPCSQCKKRFAIRRDLERHMNRIHLKVKPFNCDACDKAYLYSWDLKQHKRVAHEGYKPPREFPCLICDKVFDRKGILKGHIRTHTGERPYQCPKCPANFNQAGILGTHLKLIHLKQTRDGRPKQTRK